MSYVVTLNCKSRFTGENHTLEFAAKIGLPFRGDAVWCLACHADAVVVLAPYEWRVKCRSCGFKRSDTGETRTRETAKSHARRHRSHTVRILLGNAVVDTLPAREDTLRKSFEELCENLLTGAGRSA